MTNNKGQALVEYILIIALIVIVIVTVMKLLSGYIYDIMTETTCDISGKTFIEGEHPGEGTCVDDFKLEE